MDFCEININDKDLFDKYLNLHNLQASELTFTNMFMWRNYYGLRYTQVGGLLCIISVPSDSYLEPFAFIPVGEITGEGFKEAVNTLKEYFTKNGWELKFKRVASNELIYFKEYINPELDITFDRDNSDYVYRTEDLVNLKGKKYDGKRNHISRFKKQYEYEYVRLNVELIDECKRIMSEWYADRGLDDHNALYYERLANNELLDNYVYLRCSGAIINVNGRFEGFTVGEKLNNDTAVIHIEKANGKVNGLYPFLNQQFCKNEWQDTVYMNREQDLGVEGLRKAKLSYSPAKMIEKYTVSI